MKYDSTNRKLVLVLRTGLYQLTLDMLDGTVSLAKTKEDVEWLIGLKRIDEGGTAC